ncbi:hypothetical protein M441DRAFT_216744 [Trichoderma asperellum CBS 433.97]|uniref:Uncharacterized protein n=1 Tax=Trichoderma asperellum (strain ATCC 204424 / CBS 433.97 / NBRC 101777) TaxID=1042311 RepID=A0A2T3ZNS7_TRIA4|nr:hypothetical protein M441DRAFT_216744 [Trichoderma asperellum CBS 433.97]PTB46444.1 hypothetical protein M441DRAFT_216744 [Trichoderma asperellum CBS 433.97]
MGSGTNLTPDAKRTFGTTNKLMLEPSGGCPALAHLYQSLGAIYLLNSPMGTCHRPPNGICLKPGSFGLPRQSKAAVLAVTLHQGGPCRSSSHEQRPVSSAVLPICILPIQAYGHINPKGLFIFILAVYHQHRYIPLIRGSNGAITSHHCIGEVCALPPRGRI